MQNELGQSPKLMVCPSDDRSAAQLFTTLACLSALLPPHNMSYFVGVGANDIYPQSIAGGDRNLGGNDRRPQDATYGFSGTISVLGIGCDTQRQWGYHYQRTPAAPAARRTAVWSAKLHSAGNTAGAGNILLGDGSGQQMSSAAFQQNWLKNAADYGQFLHPRRPRTHRPTICALLFPVSRSST